MQKGETAQYSDYRAGYGLNDRGSIRGRGREFYLRYRVQTGFGAHPDFCPVGIGGCFWGIIWPGREADSSSPHSTKVKNSFSNTSTVPYVFKTRQNKADKTFSFSRKVKNINTKGESTCFYESVPKMYVVEF
jgi:hypothetical protein